MLAGESDPISESSFALAIPNRSPIVTVDQHPIVLENTTFVVDVDAVDPDGDTLEYSFVINERTGEPILDGSLFNIDSETGVLEFKVAPDFETEFRRNSIISSAPLNSLPFTVFVNVSDGTNSVVREIWMTLRDAPEENESAPRFLNVPDGIIEVQERQRDVWQFGAANSDGDKLSFSDAGADGGQFFIDIEGNLRINTLLKADDPRDADGDGIYTTTVQVSDGVRTDDVEINVRIVPLQRTIATPFFSVERVFVAEGTAVAEDFIATDTDSGLLFFSITGADAESFRYNNSTRQIELIRPLDFEAPADENGDNLYILSVTASDGQNFRNGLLRVPVTDVDESAATTAPVFTNVIDNGEIGLPERNRTVIDLDATDADGAAVFFELVGNESNRIFDIDAVSGVVTFNPSFGNSTFRINAGSGPEYESNGPNQYEFTARTTDGVNTSDVTLIVNILDIDEATNEAPQFTQLFDGTSIRVPSNDAVIVKPNAVDPEGQEVEYFIGGQDADAVYFDADTGEVRFRDPSRLSFARFYLVATDGLVSNRVDLNVFRTSGPPAIQDNQAPFIAFVADKRVPDGTTFVKGLNASDTERSPLTYSLSGVDADSFTIDSIGWISFLEPADSSNPGDADSDRIFELTANVSDGELTATTNFTVEIVLPPNPIEPPSGEELAFTNLPSNGLLEIQDFELPGDANGDNRYELVLRTSNGRTSVDHAFEVVVSNLPDAPINDLPRIPSLDGINGVVDVAEGNTLVGEFTGTDPDSSTLSYSLQTGFANGSIVGRDGWLFTIDENTGRVEFIDPPDFAGPQDADGDNRYGIIVRVFDGVNYRDYDLNVAVYPV